MTTNHNTYLNLAFHLAERNLGQTGLNPSVGSVVVKNNSVISSDVTSINGRPHSEFKALNKVDLPTLGKPTIPHLNPIKILIYLARE